MKLEFAKHVVVVDLGEYMPEMSGQSIHVWVNPPMGLRLAYFEALKDSNYERIYEITAEFLSQGPEDTRWTADELRDLLETSAVTDPRFWSWLVQTIVVSVETHRGNIKKN